MYVAPPRLSRSVLSSLVLAVIAAVALGFALGSPRWLESYRTRVRVDGTPGYAFGPVHHVELGLLEMRIGSAEVPEVRIPMGSLPAYWRGAVIGLAIGEPDLEAGLPALAERGRDRMIKILLHDVDAAHAARLADEMFVWPPAFRWFARATAVAIAVALAALALAVIAVAIGAGWRLRGAATTTAVLALAAALVAGCVTVAVAPGPPDYLGGGPAFLAMGLGVVTGLLAAIGIGRSAPRPDADA